MPYLKPLWTNHESKDSIFSRTPCRKVNLTKCISCTLDGFCRYIRAKLSDCKEEHYYCNCDILNNISFVCNILLIKEFIADLYGGGGVLVQINYPILMLPTLFTKHPLIFYIWTFQLEFPKEFLSLFICVGPFFRRKGLKLDHWKMSGEKSINYKVSAKN